MRNLATRGTAGHKAALLSPYTFFRSVSPDRTNVGDGREIYCRPGTTVRIRPEPVLDDRDIIFATHRVLNVDSELGYYMIRLQ